MDNYFDQVYCINLIRCPDRKSHMIQEFAKIGLTKYQFIEAVDADDPIVKDAFRKGIVAKFPPCFRCRKMLCSHINKKLLPSQVANWYSFRKVWKDIILHGYQRSLICEDDLVFMPYTDIVLENIFSPLNLRRRNINLNLPVLLRLGWLKSHDHQWTGHIRLKAKSKMANPCHFISLAMAQKLEQNFRFINTTSDGYIHNKIGRSGIHYTVFPPIAYELSSGKNPKIRSEIIPKIAFLEKLEKESTTSNNPLEKIELEKNIAFEKSRFQKIKSNKKLLLNYKRKKINLLTT